MLNPEHLKQLEEKRSELLRQTALLQSGPDSLAPWLPVFQELREEEVPCQLVYLFCTPYPLHYKKWQEALQHPPLNSLALPPSAIRLEDTLPVHYQVQQLYPTIAASDYLPALTYQKEEVPVDGTAPFLDHVLTFLGLQQEDLYFLTIDSPPVLRLAAADLVRQAPLLLRLGGALCILSGDLKRMVFRSAGGEWWWGEHFPYADFYRTDTPRYYVYWTTSGTPEMDDLFSAAAPAIGASFHYSDLLAAEDRFLGSDADTATYVIKGKDLWIEVLFERHESYYGWHCYTHKRDLVDGWKAWFKQLKETSKRG